MTTNIERAAEIIEDHLARSEVAGYAPNSDHLAQALAAENLLMPDLPEKERDGRWNVAHKHLPISHTSTTGTQVTIRTASGWWHTDWDEARSLGLALLAAADYAERNQE